MLKKIITFSFTIAFLTLTSCASVLRGSKEEFIFLSNPEGVNLEIYDKYNLETNNLTSGSGSVQNGANNSTFITLEKENQK